MLTQLAARLRERQANGDEDGNGDGPTIVLDDNCSVSLSRSPSRGSTTVKLTRNMIDHVILSR
jgi:hypothetical protein